MCSPKKNEQGKTFHFVTIPDYRDHRITLHLNNLRLQSKGKKQYLSLQAKYHFDFAFP